LKIVEATKETNATALAIKKLDGSPLETEIKKVIPFSSETKYSGFIDQNGNKYLMGAPEFIINNPSNELDNTIQTADKEGFRIIADLKQDTLMGLIKISDEVRKQAPATFKYLNNQGIDLKIISGDNPVTVANVAKLAGIDS